MSCTSDVISRDPCCGCIKLWIATTVVAAIEIILFTTSTVTYILSLATMNMYNTADAFHASGSANFLKMWSLDEKIKNIEAIKSRLWQIFGLALFSSVVSLAIAIVLIYAVKTRNITLVKGWILFKAIGISLCIIYLVTTILLGFGTPIGIFLDLTEIGVFLYFFWIVYAYMKKLVEEQVFKMSPSIIQTQGKIEVSFPL